MFHHSIRQRKKTIVTAPDVTLHIAAREFVLYFGCRMRNAFSSKREELREGSRENLKHGNHVNSDTRWGAKGESTIVQYTEFFISMKEIETF
jgi:hypothetical protein